MSTPSSSAGCMDALIISGLILVQVILAVYMVFLHNFLALGVNSLFLLIFSGFASALLLLPFALVLEKKKWPERLSPVVIFQLILLTVSGLAFQVLTLLGIKMTSPAIVSSMPNLAPVIIFTIAACFRFERFSIWCKYSRVKILGTVLCISGAITMSLLMSPPDAPMSMSFQRSTTSENHSPPSMSMDWILGCFYLFFSVVLLSANTVLQAATMVNFPAPFSLCIVTMLMGSILIAVWQFIMEHKLDMGTSGFKPLTIINIVLLGAVVSSMIVGFQTWCIKRKGPVMVSIFSPVQTVISALLSAVVLGQVFSIGCFAGMLLMFVGLYIVLWAKNKEDGHSADDAKIVHDVEKPLLT